MCSAAAFKKKRGGGGGSLSEIGLNQWVSE